MKKLYQCSCNKIFTKEDDALACEGLHDIKKIEEREIKSLKEKLQVLEDAFDKNYGRPVKKPEGKSKTLSKIYDKYYANGKEITADEFEKELVNFWY